MATSAPLPALVLAALSLALCLPLARSHCEHASSTCMTTGYMTQKTYNPRKTPFPGEPIDQAAQCAKACAAVGFKYFSLPPSGICGCTDTCSDASYDHGTGFSGTTYNCFLPPSGFFGPLACTAALAKKCPSKCVNKATCVAASATTHKCCCSLTYPNPIYYKGALRGCAV